MTSIDLDAVIESLSMADVGEFSIARAVPPLEAGVDQVQLTPGRATGCAIRLTDTGVSIYVECLGAKWESDSLEQTGGEGELRWVMDTCFRVARYGLVRLRPRMAIWGGETFLLSSSTVASLPVQWDDWVVVRRWSPWKESAASSPHGGS